MNIKFFKYLNFNSVINRIVLKRFMVFASVLSLTFGSGASMADDTEIYFNNASLNSSTRSNVLLILDTSGSMKSSLEGSTRIEIMKDVMTEVVTNVENVNMGIMIFNRGGDGGHISQPVKYIDESVLDNTIVKAASDVNDAEEDLSTGIVILDGAPLFISDAKGGSIVEETFVIQNVFDDADEYHTGFEYVTYLDEWQFGLYLDGATSSTTVGGMLFRGMDIPMGATIKSAFLSLTHQTDANGRKATGELTGELITAPDRFYTNLGSPDPQLQNRYKNNPTDAKVILETSPLAVQDEVLKVDVTSIVDELVNDTTWSGAGPIALYMHSSGGDLIDFYSHSIGSTTNPDLFPKLTITYTTPEDVTVDKILGFRFEDIALPQGVNVTDARLVLTSASDVTDKTTNYLISGEIPDGIDGSSDPFEPGTTFDISSRPKTTNVRWTLNDTLTDSEYASVDISSVLNQITSNSTWCGGNDLTLFMERVGLSPDGRTYYSADVLSTERMPRLELSYDPSTANGCYTAVETAQIETGADDVEQNVIGAKVDDGSGDLDLSQKFTGLRFVDLDFPPGADILSASITVTADGSSTSGSPTITIDAELSPDAAVFAEETNNLTDRPLTSGGVQVDWALPDYSSGTAYTTPDLTDMVQEVVDQGGWAQGNAMVFILGEGSNNRPTVSYNDSPAEAPRLTVSYRSPTGFEDRTRRHEMLDFISTISAGSGTPIVEVLYEAANYWTGEDVHFGASRQNQAFNRLSHEDTYAGGTVTWPGNCSPESIGHYDCKTQKIDIVPDDPVYISPFTSDLACQKNYQILLTDGSANNNNKGADLIEADYLGGQSCRTKFSDGNSIDFSDEECGIDLVEYLLENDLSTTLGNAQTVKTHTVGFVFSDQFLRELAAEGGGNFYESNSRAELLAAFNEFLVEVRSEPTSFVSPSLATNSFNRLLSREDVYFGLFTPFLEKRWPGNLKKYNVCIDSTQGCTLGEILDANGNPAVGPDNRFKPTSQSIWSDIPVVDGLSTTDGGAGAQMDDYFNDRLIFTDRMKDGSTPNLGTALSTQELFTHSGVWDKAENEHIRDAICGPGADKSAGSPCETMMLWLLGDNSADADADEDVSATTRWTVNDILHSSPEVVTYGGADTDADGIIDEIWDRVIVGTNEGGLRFFNGKTGKEEWNFMPMALMDQQDDLFSNAQDDHLYGLDGTPTVWQYDHDFDGFVEPSDGDFLHVFQAMRRGGSNIYALDITANVTGSFSPVIPKYLWSIEGGVGDFARMGQSWSEPVLANIKTGGSDFADGGTNTTVLVIGGGYDDTLDTSFGTLGTGGSANQGNAIYFVDPADGSLIFSISGPGSGADIEVPDMLYSIPSQVSTDDTDGDGDDDRVFVADTAGQVWRIDLANDIDTTPATPQGKTIVGKLASISDPATVADQRRFFEKPAFVQVKDYIYSDAAGGNYDYIVIGTGDRSNPLGASVSDRLYGFRDRNISPMTDANSDGLAEDYPSASGPIDNTTLIDVTSTILDASNTTHRAADGWYLDFNSMGSTGEKVLAEARVLNGTAILTSYLPESSMSTDACSANVGSGFSYNLNILNTKANLDWDADGTVENIDDRKLALGGGIPSEVVPVFTKEGVVGIVGVEGGSARVGKLSDLPRVRSYWYEENY
jgi:type IV pilus assembly protein PilY1